MNENPTLAIIVPAYNAERFLEKTLVSIARQSFTDWECVISDDGSTDQTVVVAKQFIKTDARFRLVSQRRGGCAAARNRGFAAINPSASFVTFMDADDVWKEDALESLVDSLTKNPMAAGAHGLADLIDADDRQLDFFNFAEFGRQRLGFDGNSIVPWASHLPSTFGSVLYSSKIYPPGVLLLRRWAIEKAGLFAPDLSGVEDWDMVIRVARWGDLVFLDRVLLHYRRHDGNMTNCMPSDVASRIHYKTFYSSENTTEHRQIVRDGWRAWQVFKMREKLDAAGENFRGGKLLRSAMMFGHVAGHCYRYLLGRPTL
jgi:glycosyltransferase involved in cell wall biosynthesis